MKQMKRGKYFKFQMFQFNSSRIFDDSNCLADESAETYSVVGFLGVGPG